MGKTKDIDGRREVRRFRVRAWASERRGKDGHIGKGGRYGICHSLDSGRPPYFPVSRFFYTNRCVYDCEYCVNRRSADVERAPFTPKELSDLYHGILSSQCHIEGLFLSSAADGSPDKPRVKSYEALRMLREDCGFSGIYSRENYSRVSPPNWCRESGFEVDRLERNIELPAGVEGLERLALQKQRVF